MRTRRRLTWLIFVICIFAVLEGLGWVTWHALRLEKREREAQAATQCQQAIRLALWRMESEVTPIIAAEAARPYFHYIPFYPAERAYTKMFQQVKANEVLVPSPLLETSGRFIRLHYQIDPEGVVTSPQAPTGNMRDMAEAQYLDSEFIVLAGQMLDEVAAMVRPADKQPLAQRELSAANVREQQWSDQQGAVQGQAPAQVWRQEQDSAEYKARERAAQTAQTANVEPQRRKSQVERPPSGDRGTEVDTRVQKGDDAAALGKLAAGAPSPPPPPSPTTSSPTPLPSTPPKVDSTTRTATSSPMEPSAEPNGSIAGDVRDEVLRKDTKNEGASQSLLKGYQEAGVQAELSRVEQGSFAARWYTGRSGEDELVLERPVQIDSRETRQGIWVDWGQLRDQLKGSIQDLLPAATLCPATDSSEAGQRLAAIPVRLLPGPMSPVAALTMTPTHTTLVVTWIAVLGAIASIGVVLRKAMELSERRGRFVSAVTHELRTPLTTFCLYTEMLSDGMVTDDAARGQYLGTLKNESTRLARIVQNVLDYAGVGGVGRRTAGPMAPLEVADLLERVRPSLERCAERAGMKLVLDTGERSVGGAMVEADPQTVERILLNLVENSGKYASDAADRRIHIGVIRANIGRKPAVRLSVRDHGPGVPKSERHMIFHAFHRATRDITGPHSGLGLGLALARELARELGGRLTLNPQTTDGAEFQVTIPATFVDT